MSDRTTHWAYSLRDLKHCETPYWARETVAEHANPEHWAAMWGWSGTDVTVAKAIANSHTA